MPEDRRQDPLAAGRAGREPADEDLGLDEVLAALSGTWAVHVLRAMAAGVSRPSHLLAAVNGEMARRGAPERLLQGTLHPLLDRLEGEHRLVASTREAAAPPRAYYTLTDRGKVVVSRLRRVNAPALRWGLGAGDDDPPVPDGVNPTVPSMARIWNALLGGRDNFLADRLACQEVLSKMPSLEETARRTREYQAWAAGQLLDLGVRQFLDIGTGLPVQNSLHEVVQRDCPESRVVYVDNDPMVLAHARALLRSSPQGACAYVDADLRDPGAILRAAGKTLDLAQPVGIFLLMILHFIPDSGDPWGIVSRLLAGVTGDAYLVVGHAGLETDAAAAMAAAREYNDRSPTPVTLRTIPQVQGFFNGMQMLDGVAPLASRRPGDGADVNGHMGLGYRPSPRQ